jgi:hypothetical protein
LIATLLVFSSLAASAYSQQAQIEEHVMPTMPTSKDDHWTHWPWSLAQPFPWSDLQGTWKVEKDDYVSYFVFKVVQLRSGVKQVQVRQIDGVTCKAIATGVGLEKGSLVYAQMTSRSGKVYRLNLTAFKRSDSPQPPLKGNVYTDAVMVLSMGELDNDLDDMVHMQIVKISVGLNKQACLSDIKN